MPRRVPKPAQKKRVPKPAQKKVDALIARASKEKGYRVCGYWKKSGGVCRKAPKRGRKRCATAGHGGRAKRGVESPTFKHGRYSKVVPRRLMRQFEAGRKDPQLLSLRNEISFIDAQLWEMIANLDELGVVETFREMNRLRRLAEAAEKQEDMAEFIAHVYKIFNLITSGVTEWQRLTQVQQMADRKQRLVESERRAVVEMRLIITAEEQAALLAEMLDIIYRNVTDVKTLARIENEFEAKLVASGDGIGSVSEARIIGESGRV